MKPRRNTRILASIAFTLPLLGTLAHLAGCAAETDDTATIEEGTDESEARAAAAASGPSYSPTRVRCVSVGDDRYQTTTAFLGTLRSGYTKVVFGNDWGTAPFQSSVRCYRGRDESGCVQKSGLYVTTLLVDPTGKMCSARTAPSGR